MHLNIELTGKCNQHCGYCSNPERDLKELSADEWLYIIQENDVKSAHLTGGEPLLYRDLLPLLQGMHQLGVLTSLLSNGSIPLRVSANATTFSKLQGVQISLDSTVPSVHDKRRKFAGAHYRATETIRVFQYMGVPVYISMVADNETVYEIKDMVDYCRLIEAKLIVRPLALLGRSTEEFDLNLFRSVMIGTSDVVVADPFGYGAPSVGVHIPQTTFDSSGQLAAAF